jgi:hypothetical protein
MFILMSHEMTPVQRDDAVDSYGIDRFVELSGEQWSQIPADIEDITPCLADLKQSILQQSQEGDILLVQGDFGATVAMVNFAFEHGLVPVYATTARTAKETVDGEKITTTRTFEHVRYRKYTKGR